MTVLALADTVLNVQISRTADGKADYLQILSPDMMALNIVLIAGTINISDMRVRKRRAKKDKPA